MSGLSKFGCIPPTKLYGGVALMWMYEHFFHKRSMGTESLRRRTAKLLLDTYSDVSSTNLRYYNIGAFYTATACYTATQSWGQGGSLVSLIHAESSVSRLRSQPDHARPPGPHANPDQAHYPLSDRNTSLSSGTGVGIS